MIPSIDSRSEGSADEGIRGSVSSTGGTEVVEGGAPGGEGLQDLMSILEY